MEFLGSISFSICNKNMIGCFGFSSCGISIDVGERAGRNFLYLGCIAAFGLVGLVAMLFLF
jgi:hypothetical protein